jgi:hypothetical protein
MKYNFKNCRVVINAGTEVLKIDGLEAPAAKTSAETMAGVEIQRTYEDYSFFMANLDGVKVGDRVRVPSFKVPAAEIDGEKKLNFDEIEVAGEYATVYKIEGEQISLVFDRALFQSAIDINDMGVWEDTQLAAYLRGAFLDALRKETSAADCGLLRKEELWGDNALPFFRNGRNRVCFDKDEDYSVWYWTETVEDASAANFCFANGNGYSDYSYASYASIYVRPRFVISAI